MLNKEKSWNIWSSKLESLFTDQVEIFYFRELEAENANLKEEYNHLKIVGQMPMTVSTMNQPDVTGTNCNTTEAEMLAEAAMLREHRNRLENRMVILEEHNRQLESQLSKLKQILEVRNADGTSPNWFNSFKLTFKLLKVYFWLNIPWSSRGMEPGRPHFKPALEPTVVKLES